MDSLIIYFLPTILALGIVTSIEDVKEGKIRNKYIAAALFLGFSIHLILYLTHLITLNQVFEQLGGIAIALAIGLSAWLFGWWGAGDAKLFLAFSSLVPPQTYTFKVLFLPQIDGLMNSLLPLFIFLLVNMLIKTTTQQKKQMLLEAVKPKRLGTTLLLIFSFSWIIRLAMQKAGLPPNYLLSVLVLLIVYKAIDRFFERTETLSIMAILSIIRIFLDGANILTIKFVFWYILTTTAVVLIITFISIGAETYRTETSIDSLTPGASLTQRITIKGALVKKADVKKYKLMKINYNRLSTGEIARLKKMHKNGKLHFNTIGVYQRIPFAPFLFFGVIATIICDGNILLLLRSALG